jgi:hypothetical protein
MSTTISAEPINDGREKIRELSKRIKAALERVGLPYKKIDCYGGQIVITSHCRDTAEKWSMVLARFAKVKKAALESVDNAVENKGTVLRPTMVKVWRTYAVIE